MKCTKREITTRNRNVITKEVYEEEETHTSNSIIACASCFFIFVLFLILGIILG